MTDNEYGTPQHLFNLMLSENNLLKSKNEELLTALKNSTDDLFLLEKKYNFLLRLFNKYLK